MAKYSIRVVCELLNESGRKVAEEEWDVDFEALSPHGEYGPWERVQGALEDALTPDPTQRQSTGEEGATEK